MKVALYKLTDCCDLEMVGDESFGRSKTNIRVTDLVEVEFKRLPKKETVELELAALDIEERKIRNELQEQLNHVNNRRSKLLALTSEVQS
jgi:hypothetical protein